MLTPKFEPRDPRFQALVLGNVHLERVYTGCRWSEGPAYSAARKYLVWSEIPNDRVMRWDETDGSIWFTDPTYGIDSHYEGDAAQSEIGASNVYRIDPDTGAVKAVITDMVKPNGLALSPDERQLYVADTGASHVPDGPRHLRRYALHTDGRSVQGDGPVFARTDTDFFDNLRLDRHGNVWSSAADGVHCLDPDGTLAGQDPGAGGGGQCVFRRPQTQSIVHLRHNQPLCDIPEHGVRGMAGLSCSPFPRGSRLRVHARRQTPGVTYAGFRLIEARRAIEKQHRNDRTTLSLRRAADRVAMVGQKGFITNLTRRHS